MKCFCCFQAPQTTNSALRAGVYYRLLLRQSLFGRDSNSNLGFGGQTMTQSSFFGQSATQVGTASIQKLSSKFKGKEALLSSKFKGKEADAREALNPFTGV